MENEKIVIYQTEDGQTQIEVRLEKESVWLTQAQMAELFKKDRTVIGRHIRNIYKEGELNEKGTCAKFAHMGSLGLQQYEATMYNLDVIISVGYRVKSSKRLADNTLVALTLMIAESKPEEKDVMVKVVVNLINQKN